VKKSVHINLQATVSPDIASINSQHKKTYKKLTVKPFLKWAGGKTNVMPGIIPHVPPLKNGCCYWEPFVGSGALFFALKPSNAVLSDVNFKLIECYKAVRENPDKIYDLLCNHFDKHSKDHFYKTRVEFNSINDKFNQASSFIYLNKAGFNGLYRENKLGEFNVPFGRKIKPSFPSLDELKQISILLSTVGFLSTSFENITDNVKKNDFVYLDPPYTVMHKNNGFIKYNAKLFSWNDQETLKHCMDTLTARGAKVLISNASHESISDLYKGYEIIEISRTSSISANKEFRTSVNEFLIKNY